MKVFILLYFLSFFCAFGSTAYTPTMRVCANIEIQLVEDLFINMKPYPKNWDEVGMVNELKSNAGKESIAAFKIINSLALVPGGYLLEEGAPREFQGYKIILISRDANSDNLDSGTSENIENGRYLILVDEKNKTARSLWLVESKIQKILSAMDGFDPASSPLAFEDIEKISRAKRNEKLQNQLGVRIEIYNSGSESLKSRTNSDDIGLKSGLNYLIGSVGLVALIIGLFWLRFRGRQKI